MSSKIPEEKTRNPRSGLYTLTKTLLDQFEADDSKNIFVIHGINGMGKTTFLEKVLIPILNSKGTLQFKLIKIPTFKANIDTLNLIGKEIKDWVYSNVLSESMKISENGDDILGEYSELRSKLVKKKDIKPFAILIDDINNLSFNELGIFQSSILETISATPKSMVVLTSLIGQDELNWNPWELTNQSISFRINPFRSEEVLEMIPEKSLVKKILALSGGHPRTVDTLANVIDDFNNVPLAQKGELNIKTRLLSALKTCINDDLIFRNSDAWLKNAFLYISPAEEFNGNLAHDLLSGLKVQVPEDVTDIAWEMANTELAYWDSNKLAYRIVPELRKRIVAFLQEVEPSKYHQILKLISKSFSTRAKLISDKKEKKKQIAISHSYFKLADAFAKTHKNKSEVRILAKEKEVIPSKALNFGGAKMESKNFPSPRPNFFLDYIPRNIDEEFIYRFLKGQVTNKWILCMKGNAGIGKSRLINKIHESLSQKSDQLTAFIDLHERKNRYRELFLSEIVHQFRIPDLEIIKSLDHLIETSRGDHTATAPTANVENELKSIARNIAAYLRSKTNGDRAVIFIDTLDTEDPSIKFFASWLVSEFIGLFNDCAYFVISGRGSIVENPLNKRLTEAVHEGIHLQVLHKLDNNFINSLVLSRLEKFKIQDKGISPIVVKLASGNPLMADWVLFFLSRNQWKIESLPPADKKKTVLEKMADDLWKSKDPTIHAFRAAAHFGSHFNLNIFKAVIPERKLLGKKHEDVFKEFSENFYIRTTPTQRWTLHDEIRDRMLDRKSRVTSELIQFSRSALNKYYPQELDIAENKLRNKHSRFEAQATYDDLIAQEYFHKLFVDRKNNYLKLWNHLDYLWHSYRPDQMFQIIRFGEEVQRWNEEASKHKDKLLSNLLDAAHVWMSYSAGDYEEAIEYATNVKSSKHRRLKATVFAALGMTEKNPVLAVNYLQQAHRLYNQLRADLEKSNRVSQSNEFCDSLTDVYQELHMVLLELAKLHWQHFFSLDLSERFIKEALDLTAQKKWIERKGRYLPLYEAKALNELARVERFKGNFDNAAKLVRRAINIYESKKVNDANLGYFYETFGLIRKADGNYASSREHFLNAEKIYDKVQVGSIEKYKASLNTEIGHLFLLLGNFNEASQRFEMARLVLKEHLHTKLFYYIGALNKSVELEIALSEIGRKGHNHLNVAMGILDEEIKLSRKYNYELWEIWALYYLEDINYRKFGATKRGRQIQANLNKILNRFRGKDFAPAFFEIEYLQFKISKDLRQNSDALMHFAKGLAYLAKSWKIRYKKKLEDFSEALLDLPVEIRKKEAEKLIKYWKKQFKKNPEISFIDVCESFIS